MQLCINWMEANLEYGFVETARLDSYGKLLGDSFFVRRRSTRVFNLL